MTTLLAQAASEYGPLVSVFGVNGAMLWVLITRLDKYEVANAQRTRTSDHILRGLSRALWFDMASRPYTDRLIKDEAHKILAEMDAEEKADERAKK